ncbi:MAG: type IV pilus assembly protein PilM [Holophagales bacterium]|nr:type IV pilus assembly protein PilM [Holophagales bacterium]
MFRKAKNLVGLDIGSSAVKLVELKAGKEGKFQLVKAGLENLSPEAIVDGAIMDSSLVVETISRLLASTGVKNANVAVSVSGHSVIVKKIQLPTMPEEELSESIRWEAEQYVPFDINDVYLDYVVLDPGAPGETMGVLLVAAKKEKVDDYKNVVTQAGRSPMLVDVDAFALQNCYEVNYGLDPTRVVALLNIGASVMNVNILASGQTVFWRDITFGGNQFTDALQKAFSLNFEQAEALKKGEPVGGQSAQSIQPVLTGVCEDVAGELQKTIDFFHATSGSDKVDTIVLSGGGSRVTQLDEVLKEKFGLPVEIMNPFRSVTADDRAVDPAWLSENGPSLAIGVGLAVRKLGE